MLWLKRTWK